MDTWLEAEQLVASWGETVAGGGAEAVAEAVAGGVREAERHAARRPAVGDAEKAAEIAAEIVARGCVALHADELREG